MTWNYRIVYHDEVEYPYYALHECFYGEHSKDGVLDMWAEEDPDEIADTVEDLISALKMQLADARKCKDDILLASKMPPNGQGK